MRKFLKNMDLWIYNLIGWLCLISAFIFKDVEQFVFLVGGAALFGIQDTIWRINDLNKD